MVDGISADRARGGHGIGHFAGRYDDAFQCKVVFGQIDAERIHAGDHIDIELGRRVTETRNDERRFTAGYVADDETALLVGNRPQPVIGDFDDGFADRMVGVLHENTARYVGELLSEEGRSERSEQYEENG